MKLISNFGAWQCRLRHGSGDLTLVASHFIQTIAIGLYERLHALHLLSGGEDPWKGHVGLLAAA
jgi:hypothetical protein